MRCYAKDVICAFVGAATLGPSFPPKWICKLGSQEQSVYAVDRTRCSCRMSCFLEKPFIWESKAKLSSPCKRRSAVEEEQKLSNETDWNWYSSVRYQDLEISSEYVG